MAVSTAMVFLVVAGGVKVTSGDRALGKMRIKIVVVALMAAAVPA